LHFAIISIAGVYAESLQHNSGWKNCKLWFFCLRQIQYYYISILK